jgi:hypothetical protein
MSVDRAEEQFAFETVRRVLGLVVEEYDIAGRRSAVDALLHYPDGRSAALEVSSIGPEDEARISSMLARRDQHRRVVAGLARSWIVSVPRSFHPRDLRALDKAILRCDQRGATDFKGSDDPQVREWRRHRVTAFATSETSPAPAVVWVVVNSLWGFADRGALTLSAELDVVLGEAKMQSKITKLAATGLSERHLFLQVRASALSFAVYDALSMDRPLPDGVPSLPAGVSQLWLFSGWKPGGVVRAVAGRGWDRVHPFD